VRRRLVLSTLTAVLLAVFLLGVPLAIAGDLLLVDQSKHDVQQRARTLALAVDHRLDEHETVDSATLEQTLDGTLRGHQVGATVTTPEGTVSVGRIPPGPAYVGEYATASGVIARVSVAQGDVRLDMVRAGGLVLAISIVAVGAAVALGVFQARRLARPLVQLAFNAERLGAGESRLAPVDSGVAEVDQVAEVLERSAQRMAVTLAAERDFTSDASHQLRTPLTALSMRLEEISAAETVQAAQEEARIALVQVERLTQVVQDLLARSRRAHHDSTQPIALDEVVSQQQQEWTQAFDGAGRSLRVEGEPGLWVEATPGALAQVLATLLDNSLAHGAGTVLLTTRYAGASVVVEVSDEGAGVPPELGQRIFARNVSSAGSTGLGLPLARDLATADGGRLELLQGTPPIFAVFLIAAQPVPDPGPERHLLSRRDRTGNRR
jgi:signal transduction histidine kinase